MENEGTPMTTPDPTPTPKLPRRVSAEWIEAMADKGVVVSVQITAIAAVIRGQKEGELIGMTGIEMIGNERMLWVAHLYADVMRVILAPFGEGKVDPAKDK